MPYEIRITIQGLRVLGIFNKNSSGAFSGSEISLKANLPSGTLYPLLNRLERAGFLKSRWEKGSPQALKRPLKRYYKITKKGKNRYLFEISRNI